MTSRSWEDPFKNTYDKTSNYYNKIVFGFCFFMTFNGWWLPNWTQAYSTWNEKLFFLIMQHWITFVTILLPLFVLSFVWRQHCLLSTLVTTLVIIGNINFLLISQNGFFHEINCDRLTADIEEGKTAGIYSRKKYSGWLILTFPYHLQHLREGHWQKLKLSSFWLLQHTYSAFWHLFTAKILPYNW